MSIHKTGRIEIRILKDIKTKMGLAFEKGEKTYLMDNKIDCFIDLSRRKREMVTAWSKKNDVWTSIDYKKVKVIGDVKMLKVREDD